MAISDSFLLGFTIGVVGTLLGFTVAAIGSFLGHRAGARHIERLRMIDDEVHGDVPTRDPWRGE
jgi:hypothetical protein